jgi:hypothetical protein
MLGATALCGGFFLVLASAARGQLWALAITIAVAGIFLAFLFYAVTLAAALVVSAFNPFRPRDAVVRSPFAQHVPAPQLVPQDLEE